MINNKLQGFTSRLDNLVGLSLFFRFFKLFQSHPEISQLFIRRFYLLRQANLFLTPFSGVRRRTNHAQGAFSGRKFFLILTLIHESRFIPLDLLFLFEFCSHFFEIIIFGIIISFKLFILI